MRGRLKGISPGGRLAGQVAFLSVLTLPLAYIGFRAMFSSWGVLDDEGYVLVGLREFVDGRALYDDIYSQYGPGLFVLVGGLLEPFGALTSDGAKSFQLLLWLGASLLTALALLRMTRNLAVAAVALYVAFFSLGVNTGEPLHPGAAICFLLIGIVATASFLLPGRPRAAMLLIGIQAAAILSMKINVGGLALISIAFAAALTMPRPRASAPVRAAACAALVALPFLLLSGRLDSGWVLEYAVVVSIGAAAVSAVALRLPAAAIPKERHLLSLAVGAGTLLAVVIAVVMLGGTTPTAMFEGIILDPLRLDDIVEIPLILDGSAWLWGLAWLAVAVAVAWHLSDRRAPGDRERALVGAARMAAGLLIWIFIAQGPGFPALPAPIWIGAPLIWIAAMPPRETGPETPFLRALIAGLAILQLLHAYPVAGSQVGWSEFLLVLVGGIGIADGVDELSSFGESLKPDFRAWRPLALVGVAAFAVWFCLVPLSQYRDTIDQRFEDGFVLGLHGADRLRLHPLQAVQLRELDADVRDRCSTFISMPGINSLYPWTGLDPPTGLNAGAWMWLLDSEKQRRVVDQISGIDDLCVVRSGFMISFWGDALGPVPDRPLVRFIEENFEHEDRYDGLLYQELELLTRRAPDGRAGAHQESP